MNIDNELVILLLNINRVCLHRGVFSEAFGKRYFHQAAKLFDFDHSLWLYKGVHPQ